MMTDAERNELVMQVIDSGYMKRYMHKVIRPWINVDDFYSDLVYATVKASRRYEPGKGTWLTYVFWSWRSVRSEYLRQSKVKAKRNVVSLDSLDVDLPEIPSKSFSFSISRLEGVVESLSGRDRFYLLGSSNKELKLNGITRSEYEIERRRIRRRLKKEF